MPVKRRTTPIQPIETPETSAVNPVVKPTVQVAEPIAKNKDIPRWLAFILVILLLASAGGFVWAYKNYQKVSKKTDALSLTEMQRQVVKKQVEELVAKVGRHIVLPQGEEPAMAEVKDAATLADEQPFYKDAHNGDRVLIYFKAQKAYLYDPNRDVLVNVGPVVLQNKPAPPVEAPAPEETSTTTE
jgi:hypothetical protein